MLDKAIGNAIQNPFYGSEVNNEDENGDKLTFEQEVSLITGHQEDGLLKLREGEVIEIRINYTVEEASPRPRSLSLKFSIDKVPEGDGLKLSYINRLVSENLIGGGLSKICGKEVKFTGYKVISKKEGVSTQEVRLYGKYGEAPGVSEVPFKFSLKRMNPSSRQTFYLYGVFYGMDSWTYPQSQYIVVRQHLAQFTRSLHLPIELGDFVCHCVGVVSYSAKEKSVPGRTQVVQVEPDGFFEKKQRKEKTKRKPKITDGGPKRNELI